MFKLYKNNINLENVKLNIKSINIINTTKISIFATLLALSLININSRKIHTIDKNNTCMGDSPLILEENTITFNEYMINNYLEKIKKYSHLLCIDENVAKTEISKKLQNIKFEDNFSILENEKYKDSVDIQCILYLKDIKANPKKYGYSSEEIIKYYNEETNLTIREMVYEYSEIFGVDKEIVLAIACGESGWFKEPIATYNNNPFSYRLKSGKFAKFETLERGIMEGILNLKMYYFDEGRTTIDSIQPKYCKEGGEHWLSLIKGTYNDLKSGVKIYDEEEKELIYGGN